VTIPRSDPGTTLRVQRALEGRCYDCLGKGQRKDNYDHLVTCPTCGGSGKLDSMSIAQVSCSAALTVAKTIDSIRDLEESGRVERVPDSTYPELWRAVRRTK
jgi:hypothetical protein